jgi:hypothetical protein
VTLSGTAATWTTATAVTARTAAAVTVRTALTAATLLPVRTTWHEWVVIALTLTLFRHLFHWKNKLSDDFITFFQT